MLRQPIASASAGANNAANTVPELPAPASPNTTPWRSGGYQYDTIGKAMANEAPATPSTMPSVSIWPNECRPSHHASSSPTITTSCIAMPTRRAFHWPINTPLSTRNNAPASTGVATIRPFWSGCRCRSLAISTASGASSTQTAKLRSKYRKQTASVGK